MNLEELIKEEIKNLKNGKLNERVKNFSNYDSKYAILKPKVMVHIELAQGFIADVDISDYFEKEVN